MPVSSQQHRVSIGLFQGKIIISRSYTRCDPVSILRLISVMMLCMLLRICLSRSSDYLNLAAVITYKHDGVYSIPVIFDLISCIFLCMCYVIPILNFFRSQFSCRQRLQNVIFYLELSNYFLICSSPVLYHFHFMLILLSGDVEQNPGPNCIKTKSLSICHSNVRSLTRSKLLAIKSSLCDIYDVITLSETYLHAGLGDDVLD